MNVDTVDVMPLYVYGIWHKPDKRWVYGPSIVTIVKHEMLSDNNGSQTWKYNLHFVSLSTGFVDHVAEGTDTREFDSRAGTLCRKVQPPTKDWGSRNIPWDDCEWVNLGEIAGP